jgi:hypothetical protein
MVVKQQPAKVIVRYVEGAEDARLAPRAVLKCIHEERAAFCQIAMNVPSEPSCDRDDYNTDNCRAQRGARYAITTMDTMVDFRLVGTNMLTSGRLV